MSVDLFESIRANLLSPMVLAFALGIVATLVRSDLKFPPEVYTTMSIYLLFAIGLKGGAELSKTPVARFLAPAFATLVLGALTSLLAYVACRRLGRMDIANSAALAAHYGSVSAVTFSAGQTFLEGQRIAFEGFMPSLVALLEVPAILLALLIAKSRLGGIASRKEVVHELLAGRSVLLLVGGLAVGTLAGARGYQQVAPFFSVPFRGVLTLFLLEMGMVAAARFRDFRVAGRFLVGFGILAPLVNGALGALFGKVSGLSLGGAVLLSIMAASASYIAAPAAVRLALPEANPSLYLTAVLAITFPFNLALGMPILYALVRALYANG